MKASRDDLRSKIFMTQPKEDHWILPHWNCNPEEESIIKGVPLELAGKVKAILKRAGVRKIRMRFRGPRGGNRYNTPKELAQTVAFYGQV